MSLGDDVRVRERKPIETWLTDMDGVLVHEGQPVPGAPDFVNKLRASGRPFLILTNNSIYTARDLQAEFLDKQRPGGTAYVIGEAGLTTAMHEIGYILTDHDPDYVVLGETRTYSFEAITTAIRLINAGARFICTNPDPTGPSNEGALPAAGSVAALISKATSVEPYFIGKPNPMMMRSALNTIEGHSETTAMIGDRMDTDILCGLEAGLETILVLTGISTPADVDRYPYRPSRIIASVAELIDEI
jgi:NagD protein